MPFVIAKEIAEKEVSAFRERTAVAKIRSFLKDAPEGVCLVRGPVGTGKSVMLRQAMTEGSTLLVPTLADDMASLTKAIQCAKGDIFVDGVEEMRDFSLKDISGLARGRRIVLAGDSLSILPHEPAAADIMTAHCSFAEWHDILEAQWGAYVRSGGFFPPHENTFLPLSIAKALDRDLGRMECSPADNFQSSGPLAGVDFETFAVRCRDYDESSLINLCLHYHVYRIILERAQGIANPETLTALAVIAFDRAPLSVLPSCYPEKIDAREIFSRGNWQAWQPFSMGRVFEAAGLLRSVARVDGWTRTFISQPALAWATMEQMLARMRAANRTLFLDTDGRIELLASFALKGLLLERILLETVQALSDIPGVRPMLYGNHVIAVLPRGWVSFSFEKDYPAGDDVLHISKRFGTFIQSHGIFVNDEGLCRIKDLILHDARRVVEAAL